MDSEIGLPGKSRAEISRLSPIFAPKKWLWVITNRMPESTDRKTHDAASIETDDFTQEALRALAELDANGQNLIPSCGASAKRWQKRGGIAQDMSARETAQMLVSLPVPKKFDIARPRPRAC
jgi:hypothetical protein